MSADSTLPGSRDRLLPWLGAANVMALITAATVAVAVDLPTTLELTTLLLCLGATLAGTGLVAARANRLDQEHDREERGRPARDQLLDLDGSDPSDSLSYLEGMERWATALRELTAHAVELSPDGDLRHELDEATEDTDALRALLQGSVGRPLGLSEIATLHSVCALWETNQERIEGLAAGIDGPFHRRWQARSVVDRRLRHGPVAPAGLALPYRS